ncbi:hypothetical protein RB593_008327 [Gaeumannomyces tritici]
MQFQTLVLAAFAAVAAAQTQTTPTLPTSVLPSRTTTAPATRSTSNLVALVQGLPSCGIKCLSGAAKQANCDAADLKCLCANAGSLTNNISLISCVASNCNSDQQASITRLGCSPGLRQAQQQPQPGRGLVGVQHRCVGPEHGWRHQLSQCRSRAQEDGRPRPRRHGWCRCRLCCVRHVKLFSLIV